MIVFWLVAAVMITGALASVLPPLLGRRGAGAPSRAQINVILHNTRMVELDTDRALGTIGDEEYAPARADLERAALDALGSADGGTGQSPTVSPIAAVVIALLVPTVSFGLYLTLGTPQAITGLAQASTPAAGSAASADAESQMQHSLTDMIAGLEARLETQPDDAEGWGMLGRSYAALDQLEAARSAFRRALKLRSDDGPLMIDYAQVLAGLNDGDLRGEATDVVHAALRLGPDNPKGLWLAGIAALQRGDFENSVETLERFRSSTRLEGEQARVVDEIIEQTRAAMGQRQAGVEPAAAAAGAQLSVSVALAPEIADRTDPTDTVFVFARAAQGPRMPLAIVRKQVSDLPVKVTLDDSQAMTPQLKLSSFSEIVVGARISKSGNAMARPGDLQGFSAVLKMSDVASVDVAIDEVVP